METDQTQPIAPSNSLSDETVAGELLVESSDSDERFRETPRPAQMEPIHEPNTSAEELTDTKSDQFPDFEPQSIAATQPLDEIARPSTPKSTIDDFSWPSETQQSLSSSFESLSGNNSSPETTSDEPLIAEYNEEDAQKISDLQNEFFADAADKTTSEVKDLFGDESADAFFASDDFFKPAPATVSVWESGDGKNKASRAKAPTMSRAALDFWGTTSAEEEPPEAETAPQSNDEFKTAEMTSKREEVAAGKKTPVDQESTEASSDATSTPDWFFTRKPQDRSAAARENSGTAGNRRVTSAKAGIRAAR